jgi:hypothetical protein
VRAMESTSVKQGLPSTEFRFTNTDGLQIMCARWDSHGPARAVVQGDFGEGGFDLLVEDMVRLSRIAKEENPNLPFILMGHSMGSFASQQCMLDHSHEILPGSGDLGGLSEFGKLGAARQKYSECPLRTRTHAGRLAEP